MAIPVEDLTRQYAQIADELEPVIKDVLARGKYTLGPQLAAFEEEFAAYCDCKYALGIANGTAALQLALAALGIGRGAEVITVCNTYVATAFAISYVGATPVFVDVARDTFNMDLAQVERKISARTKAIIPVHLYGQPVEITPLLELARQHNLPVIEDAAHAHGAVYYGKKTGSFGAMGCFSFYPTKVIGAFGDGGALTTNDEYLYRRVKQLRYMGQKIKYVHQEIGFQERLDELQAALLRVKLRHLDQWLTRRRQWAQLYNELLAPLGTLPHSGIITPYLAPNRTHSYYMYTIRVPNGQRDALCTFLEERGIGTLVVYPQLVPFQGAYTFLGHQPGDFPIAESLRDDLLCLPIFPELTEPEVRTVAATIAAFYDR